jgi:tetratricopeptide (TPR) repeat protein
MLNERWGLSRDAAARAYREAFRAHGLDLEAGDTADLARRVRDSAIREELVTALDEWTTTDAELRPRLAAVARAADPGPWKDLVRDLDRWKDRNALKARLAGIDVAQLTPTLLVRVGSALREHEEGLELLRAAQRRYSTDFWLNYTLARVLHARGRTGDSVRYLQAALVARPQRAAVHNSLGVALMKVGQQDEALAYFEQALRLDPLLYPAHANRGAILLDRGRLDEAVTGLRRAIGLRNDYSPAYINLGTALEELGRLDEAVAAFREAVRLQPTHAFALVNLGRALRDTGRFADALAQFRRGDELGKAAGWSLPSADWVRDCERLIDLDRRLPAVLTGDDRPRDARERHGFARVCHYKGLHTDAARFYAEVFADGLGSRSDRYAAARSAASAADADGPDDIRRAELRRQALDWLTAELDDLKRIAQTGGEKARATVRELLIQRQRSPELAGVRDEEALARLPEAEVRTWRDFWARVAALAR